MVRALAAAVCMLLMGTGEITAQNVKLRWNLVGPAVTGKTVTVVTHEGTRIKGKVLRVDAQSVVVKQAGREVALPRDSVERFELARRGKGLRAVLTGIGCGVAGFGATAGILALTAGGQEPANPTRERQRNFALAVGGAAAVGGVIIGISTGREAMRKPPKTIWPVP